jgi:RNA polymerase sigma-70 factor (ECF subfamily)
LIAIEDAWRRWYPIAREKALRVLERPGEAEDVAQEAFVRLWQTGMAESEPQRASAWLYRTTTRLSIDRLRAERCRNGAEAAIRALAPPPVIEDRSAARHELERLASLIPEAELEAAILHRVDRLDQGEIAKVLGVTERTVRRLLNRLERRLEQLRGGEEP